MSKRLGGNIGCEDKKNHGIKSGSPMVVSLGLHYHVGEKSTIILYTYINGHAETPNKTKTRDTMSLDTAQFCYIRSKTRIGWVLTLLCVIRTGYRVVIVDCLLPCLGCISNLITLASTVGPGSNPEELASLPRRVSNQLLIVRLFTG